MIVLFLMPYLRFMMRVVLAFAILFAASVTFIVGALGHEAPSGFQYPLDCCGERDCHPVPCVLLKLQANGLWLYIPKGLLFQTATPSPDGQCHVCFPESARSYGRCLFMPQGDV